MTQSISLAILNNPNFGKSYFKDKQYALDDYNGMFISQRQEALNFRHRKSNPGYFSDWHVAGDPTLIIIRSGVMRVGLRDNQYRDFSAGDMFIAKDYLPDNILFDHNLHGHTAAVLGEQPLLAVHIKLAKV